MNNMIEDKLKIALDESTELEWLQYKSIDSTQLHGRRNKELITLNNWKLWTADSQTHGIGQRGNKWFSPKKSNIYATFGCRFIKTVNLQIINIPQITALAIIKLLYQYNILGKLKWPNDILVSGKKIGGVLVEAFTTKEEITLLIGIGLNVNLEKDEFYNVEKTITSMKVEKDKIYNKKSLLLKFSHILFSCLVGLQKNGFTHYLEEINTLLETFKDHLIIFDTFSEPKKYLKCLIHKIDNQGKLVLYNVETYEYLTFHKGKILDISDSTKFIKT